MTDPNVLFRFVNVLHVAQVCAAGSDAYQLQEALVAECRAKKTPFLAEMPLRLQVQCPVCKVTQGEVEMHFEDPNQLITSNDEISYWQSPVGHFVNIQRSVLHGIFAHGNDMPENLKALLANVRG